MEGRAVAPAAPTPTIGAMTDALVDVVGIALPGGPAFVDELRRAWDAGAAVAPIDVRLSGPTRDAAVAVLAPTVIVDEQGRHRTTTGRGTDAGDALVVATSGTSGEARAAVLTHDAVAAAARATSAALAVDPAADRWLACLPLAHVGGLSVVTRALLTETPLEVHPGFDAHAVRAAVSATLVSLVPAVLDRIDPTAFRRILLGGSSIPADRPPKSVATYGMTETGGGVVYDGRPLDGVEVRAVDGELQLRCPMLLRCYRGPNGDIDPGLRDGWFATGDAGKIRDGKVDVLGRTGDVIVTGGESVWPAPVEAVLAEHPAVAAVAVVGRPDREWGEAVTAVIEREPDAEPPTLDELRDHVKARLPAWFAPHRIEFVEAFPRTSVGKIRRRGL